jgi:hypothetical protein
MAMYCAISPKDQRGLAACCIPQPLLDSYLNTAASELVDDLGRNIGVKKGNGGHLGLGC